MYTHEQAIAIAEAFRARRVEGVENVRVEQRAAGDWRAVYDTFITCGKRGSDKRVCVTRSLIAGWHREVPADVWALIEGPLTEQQATTVRAAVEAILPSGWRFGSRWFEAGAVWLVRDGKRTLVTMHCEEPCA